jgi:hypothetical protein
MFSYPGADAFKTNESMPNNIPRSHALQLAYLIALCGSANTVNDRNIGWAGGWMVEGSWLGLWELGLAARVSLSAGCEYHEMFRE